MNEAPPTNAAAPFTTDSAGEKRTFFALITAVMISSTYN